MLSCRRWYTVLYRATVKEEHVYSYEASVSPDAGADCIVLHNISETACRAITVRMVIVKVMSTIMFWRRGFCSSSHSSCSPWYDLRGWLGVKQQLYIYISLVMYCPVSSCTISKTVQGYSLQDYSQKEKCLQLWSREFARMPDQLQQCTVLCCLVGDHKLLSAGNCQDHVYKMKTRDLFFFVLVIIVLILLDVQAIHSMLWQSACMQTCCLVGGQKLLSTVL